MSSSEDDDFSCVLHERISVYTSVIINDLLKKEGLDEILEPILEEFKSSMVEAKNNIDELHKTTDIDQKYETLTKLIADSDPKTPNLPWRFFEDPKRSIEIFNFGNRQVLAQKLNEVEADLDIKIEELEKELKSCHEEYKQTLANY